MREDYERLDWLERTAAEIDITIRAVPDLDHLHARRLEIVVGRASTAPGRTLREALDVAMETIRL